ncbi:serine hydrolase domain-containing protein [Streptomyces sp. H27-D2]|uniref:serine hydrolase domain-containing protein n=1 Tax=Streptomyces sp. H27-D2 TaxID=3046304 RepID=UPI002DC01A2F|nr:serine hydrolase domain-containing protein [Streptomyces sp. H27-D2]MEC4019284.1 serine hydrolase domain-containing protein [Streptomyces sp. H27-D2]
MASPRVSHGHDADAFVEIGSLTKVLTGTAWMRMAAAGAIGADDLVDHWLDAPAGTGITLRHLAEHTSGLPRLPPDLARADPYASFNQPELQKLLRRLPAITLQPPGAEETYSNLGYAVLGAALTAASALPYEDLIREYVLDPLGLSDLVTAHPPAQRLHSTGAFGRRRPTWTMDGAILPAGGMWATPRAAARLLTGILLDAELGPIAPTWRTAGPLKWHNGATRNASVFAGAFPNGPWVLVHRLGGAPDRTEEIALQYLTEVQ